MWYKRPLCRVVPFKASTTLRGTKARYAEVVWSACFIQAQLLVSFPTWKAYASAWLFIKALAQHALAADAASRRARSGLFSALVSATMWLPFIGSGAAKAQPVGRVLGARLS